MCSSTITPFEQLQTLRRICRRKQTPWGIGRRDEGADVGEEITNRRNLPPGSSVLSASGVSILKHLPSYHRMPIEDRSPKIKWWSPINRRRMNWPCTSASSQAHRIYTPKKVQSSDRSQKVIWPSHKTRIGRYNILPLVAHGGRGMTSEAPECRRLANFVACSNVAQL
jgi:hypothetical protein